MGQEPGWERRRREGVAEEEEEEVVVVVVAVVDVAGEICQASAWPAGCAHPGASSVSPLDCSRPTSPCCADPLS